MKRIATPLLIVPALMLYLASPLSIAAGTGNNDGAPDFAIMDEWDMGEDCGRIPGDEKN